MTDGPSESEWTQNYFNYFTEIEEHFQRARGTSLFLLSPLDWALIETWKSAEVPLEAVLQGIDSAFEKWRSRKVRTRSVNSLAYCAQAVAVAVTRAPGREQARRGEMAPPFSADELRKHLGDCSAAIRAGTEHAVLLEIAVALEAMMQAAVAEAGNLEQLERKLTALEDKMVAAARTLESDADLYGMREALDSELRPYRGKMTAEQLAMLERRYLDAAMLQRAKLPRLSLFYLR